MSPYDILMIALLIAGLVHGAWKGLAWQLAPIAALVLGYAVALPVSATIAPWFGSQAPMNQYVALLLCYVAVSLAVFLIALSIREAIARIKLQEFDRHLGTLLGGVKGLLLCLVITFFAVAMSPEARDYVLKTRSGYAAAVVMSHLDPIMPPALHDRLHPYIHSLDEALPPGARPHADASGPAMAVREPAPAEPAPAPATPKDSSGTSKLLRPVLRLADRLSNDESRTR